MLKPSFLLFLVAVAALTACAARERVVTPAPTVIVTPPAPGVAAAPAATSAAPSTMITQAAPLRPGIGVIESIGPVPQWSSSTGGGQPSAMRRVGVKMDDGTLQIVDTSAPSLRTGDRIELTSDGFIRQPAQ